tara:strand:+ start:1001 stop:2449 length:1449 start_codon:yes stop_codon:yes gene_type:complete
MIKILVLIFILSTQSVFGTEDYEINKRGIVMLDLKNAIITKLCKRGGGQGSDFPSIKMNLPSYKSDNGTGIEIHPEDVNKEQKWYWKTSKALSRNASTCAYQFRNNKPLKSCDKIYNWIDKVIINDKIKPHGVKSFPYYGNIKYDGSSFNFFYFIGMEISNSYSIALQALFPNNEDLKLEKIKQYDMWLGKRLDYYNEMYNLQVKQGKSRAQNHLVALELANMSLALLANDKRRFKKSIEQWKTTLDSINPDGSFPEEAIRGDWAINYTSKTITGLLRMVRIMKVQGYDLLSNDTYYKKYKKSIKFLTKSISNNDNIFKYAKKNYRAYSKNYKEQDSSALPKTLRLLVLNAFLQNNPNMYKNLLTLEIDKRACTVEKRKKIRGFGNEKNLCDKIEKPLSYSKIMNSIKYHQYLQPTWSGQLCFYEFESKWEKNLIELKTNKLISSNQAPKTALQKAKSTCTDLGFTPKTEKHGDCVMKMIDR